MLKKLRARRLRRQFVAKAKRLEAKYAAYVDDYVGEAEHQEGEEYWLMFADADEAVRDFKLYVDSI